MKLPSVGQYYGRGDAQLLVHRQSQTCGPLRDGQPCPRVPGRHYCIARLDKPGEAETHQRAWGEGLTGKGLGEQAFGPELDP